MNPVTVVMFVILFVIQCCFARSSNFHKSAQTPNCKRRTGGTSTVSRNVSQSTGVHRRRTRITAKTPQCCQFFLWNFPSACRYHLCNYLMRDCVYEGLGGKKVNWIRY
jgi:hypothetical protein